MKKKKTIIRMGPQNSATQRDSMNGILTLSGDISVSKKDCTSMGSEYLALIDAASKLGTYQLNRDAPPLHKEPCCGEKCTKSGADNKVDVENVREEAELLWKFATSAPCVNEAENMNENDSPISPSLSFEAQRYFSADGDSSEEDIGGADSNEEKNIDVQCHHRTCRKGRGQGQAYSLTFPCLSLSDIPQSFPSTPAHLFSRHIKTHKNSDGNVAAETLASNIMQSFLMALDLRGKVWIKSLSDYLNAEYKFNREKIGQGLRSKGNHMGGSECQVNNDTVSNNLNRAGGEFNKAPSSSLALLHQQLIQSKEARVLRAISYVATSVIVHDARTTFHVLEQQVDRTLSNGNVVTDEDRERRSKSTEADYGERQTKRRKTRRYCENPYKLSHTINLETRCTVSTTCKESRGGQSHMSIVLQSPGVINGTFLRSCDGSIKLVDVVVELDTHALASSMEDNSRLVIRTAAQNYILCPPKTEQCTHSALLYSHGIIPDDISESEYEYDEDDSLNDDLAKYTPTPTTPLIINSGTQYPEAVMVTPLEQGSSSSSESEDMPPPPPRLPFEDDDIIQSSKMGYVLHPRRVSPPMISSPRMDGGCNVLPDSFTSPTPSKPAYNQPTTSLALDGKVKIQSTATECSAPPFLVSPRTPSDEGESKQNVFVSRSGPSLPALVEVACAAHARFC